MCRLYGFRASELTKVECTLVYAQNALMRQSRGDLRGETHPDGWGISCYEDKAPRLEKRELAAYQDAHFSVTVERIYARTVIAHVRAATVGEHSVANTHPFVYGRWTFAHNGTLRGFAAVWPWMRSQIDEDLLASRKGDTDSEGAFYFLLARARREGLDIESPDLGDARWVGILAESILELDRRCFDADPVKSARLNFVLTDGQTLLASRWRNTLFCVERDGIHDCEICGIPHIHHSPRHHYRAAVVASEPITGEAWEEVPEQSILSINSRLELALHAV